MPSRWARTTLQTRGATWRLFNGAASSWSVFNVADYFQQFIFFRNVRRSPFIEWTCPLGKGLFQGLIATNCKIFVMNCLFYFISDRILWFFYLIILLFSSMYYICNKIIIGYYYTNKHKFYVFFGIILKFSMNLINWTDWINQLFNVNDWVKWIFIWLFVLLHSITTRMVQFFWEK